MKPTAEQLENLGPVWTAAIDEWELRGYEVSAVPGNGDDPGDLHISKANLAYIMVFRDCSLNQISPVFRNIPAPSIVAKNIIAKVNEWLEEAESAT